MTTVITYGTFDLFHIGHVNLLNRLKGLGDRLVVGCSTDEFNAKKGKKALVPYEQRARTLESCRYVDAVFPEETWDQKPADIQRERADIFAMGDDWVGKFDDLGKLCRVVYLPRTENVSSTDLRQVLDLFKQEEVHRLEASAEHLLGLIRHLRA
jgi:glycerol-3-phosphate cytidylyltransferase